MPSNSEKINVLMEKGVNIPLPSSVLIGDSVDLKRISGDRVTLHPGTKILGRRSLVMAGVTLGIEGPVTLDNTAVGPNTSLKGGFFQDAVFVGSNVFGSGAHVRGGTILEEEASAAHTVGLKQTLLFPFVTLGSLINFCDCFMAGGTSRKNHSEVGSSFIHFNYTPNQDKATPSMMGTVHQGVMLKRRPIFLGGQGGIVGPLRLAFGTVTAAGTIVRRDEERPNRIIIGASLKGGSIPRQEQVYNNPNVIYNKNCRYLAGLIALMNWYRSIRSLFVSDFFSKELHAAMKETLQKAIDERVKRLDDFCTKLETSKQRLLSKSDGSPTALSLKHDAVIRKWPASKAMVLKNTMEPFQPPDSFLQAVKAGLTVFDNHYITVIKGLEEKHRSLGTAWLQGIETDLMKTLAV